jgi:hypothetical protein
VKGIFKKQLRSEYYSKEANRRVSNMESPRDNILLLLQAKVWGEVPFREDKITPF